MMMRANIRPVLLALTLHAARPVVAAAQSGPAAKHLALVRPRFSGPKAYETVAYLDHFVRWPGNAGFDSSIAHVAAHLAAAGYVEQSEAKPTDRLTYRIERYPMSAPAWEPLDASVSIAGAGGHRIPVLAFASNRNMLAQNSFSTPDAGVDAELVRIDAATPAAVTSAIAVAQVRGKIVLIDGRLGTAYDQAVKAGAAGVLAYSMPGYTKPELHQTSIQFTSIRYDSEHKSWGMMISYAARAQLMAALAKGPVTLHVMTKTRFTSPATELTVVADIRGSKEPGERFVYSAHVQEPGANDNATGVGALTEMARVAADLVKNGLEDPKRTLTFIWGLEVTSTRRYITQDSERAKGIHWGMSLDMVGEDTKKTGGTFLIEKMPDPSAIWTRGDDHHTEWGGSVMTEAQMFPHYYNDFIYNRCLDQAQGTNWVVRTNPYEGGSDHTPFISAKKPGLLLWHFTDVYYHTDGDRIDKVSVEELRNSGIAALISGLTLASADGPAARAIIGEVERAAVVRIETERAISADFVARGGDPNTEIHIIETWGNWYRDAIRTADDIEVGGPDAETKAAIDQSVKVVQAVTAKAVKSLKPE
jgi:hypothetical protein